MPFVRHLTGEFILKIFALVVAATVLGMPALAQSIGERAGINSLTGAAPKTEDFVMEAAVSDIFEIQSSQLAQNKAQDAGLKTFASKMVADHTMTSNELKALVTGGK